MISFTEHHVLIVLTKMESTRIRGRDPRGRKLWKFILRHIRPSGGVVAISADQVVWGRPQFIRLNDPKVGDDRIKYVLKCFANGVEPKAEK